ncbi:MAG: hypothetical protein NTW58_06690 [Actinobacteria bacterium]|nr:hypothetical protein [Actinomycetota bacterium]
MRSRLTIYIVIGLVAAVALVAGVVAVAGAGSSTSLPAISAPELMAKMGQSQGQVQAVSGEISWTNNLFGDLGSAAQMGQLPAQSPLTSNGSGRIWVSEAGMRVESQGSGGDQVAGVSKATRTAWTYDSATNTVRSWVMTGDAPANEPMPSPSASMMTPAAISMYLRQLAPYATVDVAGQSTVAGREVYLLRMTPVADDTALGAVQASIDGKTMVPLRLEVFAKSGGAAVLQFGFDSVSYDPIDAAMYDFTPPAGAKVTTKQIDPSKMKGEAGAKAQFGLGDGGMPSKADKAAHQKLARRALLTLEQAQSLVDYQIASARDYTARPFRWAYVFDNGMPVTALGNPVFQMMGLGGSAASSPTGEVGAKMGPASVLLYGDGFGAIALAQTKTTPELEKQLKQLPALVDTTTVNGAQVRSMTTPLGGVYLWQQGETTLMAGGMVPKADLDAFVTSVR